MSKSINPFSPVQTLTNVPKCEYECVLTKSLPNSMTFVLKQILMKSESYWCLMGFGIILVTIASACASVVVMTRGKRLYSFVQHCHRVWLQDVGRRGLR